MVENISFPQVIHIFNMVHKTNFYIETVNLGDKMKFCVRNITNLFQNTLALDHSEIDIFET